MPQTAKDLIGEPIHIFDSSDPSYPSLYIVHAVDITDVCQGNGKERKLVLYTHTGRGILFKIMHCYEGETNMGSSVHYYLEDFEGGLRRSDLTANFFIRAGRYGLTPQAFLELIREHAPAPKKEN